MSCSECGKCESLYYTVDDLLNEGRTALLAWSGISKHCKIIIYLVRIDKGVGDNIYNFLCVHVVMLNLYEK